MTTYYISTVGASGNNGLTEGAAWDIASGLTQLSHAVAAGDTIIILGGTYSVVMDSTLVGASGNPVIVTVKSAEDTADRVIINGSIQLKGAWQRWLGKGRNAVMTQLTPVATNTRGFEGRGQGNELVNWLVHDCGQTGVLWTQEAFGGGGTYGCISYNNGFHDSLDHGFYQITNTTDAVDRFCDECVAFNNWAYGIQCYGDVASGNQGIRNIKLRGCVGYNNGTIAVNYAGKPNFLQGGTGISVLNGLIDHCYSYHQQALADGGIHLGFDALVTNDSATVTNNRVWGGGNGTTGSGCVQVGHFTAFTCTNNQFGSSQTRLTQVLTETTYTWNTNTYFFANANSSAFRQNGVNKTFALWQAGTTYDAASTATGSASGKPTVNFVTCRPNSYEAGRGHIIVENWQALSAVPVDISSVISVGQYYKIWHVHDLFGTPIQHAKYTGGTISLPLSTVALPPLTDAVGRGANSSPVNPGTEFGVYLLLATTQAPGADDRRRRWAGSRRRG